MADAARFFVYPDESPESFQLQGVEDSGDPRNAADRAFTQYMNYVVQFLQGRGGPLEVLS
jgi:hypothetical protein